MADCSTVDDARTALAEGATIIGTTMSGYTDETASNNSGPDLDLVKACHALGAFVMAEGRFNTPDLAAQAILAGASSVTVGSALTRLEIMTGWFRDAVEDVR